VALIQEVQSPQAEPSVLNFDRAFPLLEGLLQQSQPLGFVYLDTGRFMHLERNLGPERFDRIIEATSEILKSFSGRMFRTEDILLMTQEMGDVFLLVLTPGRSKEPLSYDTLAGISESLQNALNQELTARMDLGTTQRLEFFSGCSLLFPDERINPQRQIFRAIKEAALDSHGKQNVEFDRKIAVRIALIRARNFTSFFQPIIDFEPFHVLGHELLSRPIVPPGGKTLEPQVMFDLALQQGLALDLERACREVAIRTLSKTTFMGKIFLNHSPQIIMNDEFSSLLLYDRLGWNPDRVVIEITEGEAIKNIREIRQRLKIFRDEGCQIAIDDIGKGHSGLFLLADIKPDFAKIDMTLIRDIDKDPIKQKLVKKLVEFGEDSPTQFIAEGIETENEYRTLCDLGIRLGQGYFLGRPLPNPAYPKSAGE